MEMADEIDIHEPISVTEYREALGIIAAGWREAFGEIVTEEALREMAAQADRDDVEDQFYQSKSTEYGAVMVGTLDDTVVGTGSVVWGHHLTKNFVGPADAEVRTLYVDPEWWGRGIGSALLEALVAESPATANRLVLETFRDNRIGRHFYETRGFSQIGEGDFVIAGQCYPTVLYARSR